MQYIYWLSYQTTGTGSDGRTYSSRQTAELEFDEPISSFAQIRLAEGMLYGQNRAMLERYSQPSCVIREWKLLRSDNQEPIVEGTYYYWALYELSGVSPGREFTKLDSAELVMAEPITDVEQVRDEEQKILDRWAAKMASFHESRCVILTWQLLRVEQNVLSSR